MPDVTVLMTVYNGMPYLPAAIDSVLKQTFTDFEFLIINDCSTDCTRDVILAHNDSRIRLVDNPVNLKQTRSLNKGLGLAKGDIIARLDADDVCHLERLARQVAYLKVHTNVAVVGTNIRYIDENGRVTGKCSRPQGDLALRWLQLFVCPIGCGVAAFRNSVVRGELGGFDESIIVPQDWDLWSRLMGAGYKVGSLPQYLVDVRRHSGCETVTSSRLKMEEAGRILRMNPKRILDIDVRSKAWLRKIDSLHGQAVHQPKERICTINSLFDRFCDVYPEAISDPEVIEQLVIQYARSIIKAKPARIWQALGSLISTWPGSIKPNRAIYHLFRTIFYGIQWGMRT